jgi:hypothetical protein
VAEACAVLQRVRSRREDQNKIKIKILTPRVLAAVAEACAVVQRGRGLRQDHAGAHAQGAQFTCFTSTKVQILTRALSFMLQSSASFHPLLASLLAMLAKVCVL